jgi:antitoxin CptB
MRNILNNQSKLQWACRRGMLELDILLNNFLQEAYMGLNLEDKAHFAVLLEQSDPELFSWLLGQEVPADSGLLRITERIRQHARSRISNQTI